MEEFWILDSGFWIPQARFRDLFWNFVIWDLGFFWECQAIRGLAAGFWDLEFPAQRH
jgi:hypothetical protein